MHQALLGRGKRRGTGNQVRYFLLIINLIRTLIPEAVFHGCAIKVQLTSDLITSMAHYRSFPGFQMMGPCSSVSL